MYAKIKWLLTAIGVLATISAHASSHDFFKGKTIRLVVGFSPGGTFDLWARAIAQHMGKYIPGNPALVVQNMPGGGSMIAANYIYSVAKPDGLTIGTVSPSLYIEQLMARKEVQYRWEKFSWIGQPERTDRIFYMRADTPYRTLEDIRSASEPPKCGATGLGTAERRTLTWQFKKGRFAAGEEPFRHFLAASLAAPGPGRASCECSFKAARSAIRNSRRSRPSGS